ncbi:larval cuticle protein 65Ag1-like [Culex pipiens pallens]|uniref:larval cuticle protein 65Ag1-like n=1 Tax=Culex pipiens pallens TaxID=42434 RepID=UPI001952F69A|nr:larval cuticle protein 65Ag1-like [Culex pipiens pallens]
MEFDTLHLYRIQIVSSDIKVRRTNSISISLIAVFQQIIAENTSPKMNTFIAVFVALFALAAAAPQQSGTTPVPIVSESSDIQPDGSFKYAFKSGDGTEVQDEGALKQVQVPKADGSGTETAQALVQTGSFSYQAPDGQQIKLTYTADETGFHPQGAHLPVAPVDPNHP